MTYSPKSAHLISINRRQILSGLTSLSAVLATPNVARAVSEISPSALSREEVDVINALSNRINDISTMQGEFIQLAHDGSQTEGYFVLHRPGRLLFRYKPPTKLEIIADGKALMIRDRATRTNDVWPIGQTPLRFLLESNINLIADSKVLGVRPSEEDMTVVMEETTPAGTGRIALVVDPATYDIRQWTITDPQGLDTTVALFNIEYGKPTDPKWFRIENFKPKIDDSNR